MSDRSFPLRSFELRTAWTDFQFWVVAVAALDFKRVIAETVAPGADGVGEFTGDSASVKHFAAFFVFGQSCGVES